MEKEGFDYPVEEPKPTFTDAVGKPDPNTCEACGG
jgi:hypothetical protein